MSVIDRTNLRPFLDSFRHWTRLHRGHELREYQLQAAEAALALGPGDKGVMVFSRQAGKDETLAQLIGFLLMRSSVAGGSIVLVAPSGRPQAMITRDRTYERLADNPIGRRFARADGPVVRVGRAKATFVGANGNIRGQTASIILIGNEAQDLEVDRWDAAIEPMGASTNAPTLLSGTVWTSDTLLAREMRYGAARAAEDGVARVHKVPWPVVAAEIPGYGDRVRARIAQFGEAHPFIRTEYLLEELSGEGGLFGGDRRLLLAGTHPRRREPMPGERVALLIDVAGGEEERYEGQPGGAFDPEATRDSTALTVVAIEGDELNTYRVLDRQAWTGGSWVGQREAIRGWMRRWNPVVTVVDATGIGYGLLAWLREAERRRRIEAFVFTAKSKSDLGWTLTGLIDSGRLTDYDPGSSADELTREFWQQVDATVYAIASAHTRLMRWGVPSPGHDDLVLSLALVGALEELDLRPRVARGG